MSYNVEKPQRYLLSLSFPALNLRQSSPIMSEASVAHTGKKTHCKTSVGKGFPETS